MEADFSGWVTKAGIKCTDGRTIEEGAFKHQHTQKVPLVWMHGHKDPENVLGHVLLEHRDGGVYGYAFFNKSPKAQHMKESVDHKDITQMSIWANELVQKSGKVLHGAIREVSLVLSGANPGAVIENIAIRHGDGSSEEFDDEAIIKTGLELEHEQIPEGSDLLHAEEEDKKDDDKKDDEDDKTLLDIYESMTDEEKQVVHYMVGQALAAADEKDDDTEAKQTNVDGNEDETIKHDDSKKEGSDMTTHNIFEGDKTKEDQRVVLSHSDMQEILAEAVSSGSLKKAVHAYAAEHLEHGIQGLDLLFPEARAVTTTPEFDKRRTEWVANVLGGVTKRPFSRIKSWTADLTYEEARAKGYVKGTMKKEEFFSISKRETGPQTVYKKQKLDRDDILDITDFDVVVWMKGEMRVMLEEEIARAILLGDGRAIDHDDKIQEDKIRPIAFDDPFYAIPVFVNLGDAESSIEEVLDAATLHREFYKGTGTPDFYTTERFISQVLLVRDEMGRKIYRSVEEIATTMRVGKLVAVEVMNEYPELIGVMVNLSDYSTGTDRGGEVNFFEDFDIDFNQNKYLTESRLSGALAKMHSALVFFRSETADAAAIPEAPAWDSETGTATIPLVTGIEYRDQDGDVLAAGALVVPAGTNIKVQAWAEDGYYIPAGYKTSWSFLSI